MKNSGIDFDRLERFGIDHLIFSENLITSGLLFNPSIIWYGFHTDHDFAYLLRLITGVSLANTEAQFLNDLNIVFPHYYDIKVIAEHFEGLYRGSLATLCY